MRWSTAIILLALAPLAGCILPTDDSPSSDDGAPTSGSAATPPSGSSTRTATTRPTSSPGLPGNDSDDNRSVSPPREWAALGIATIRPGVQVVADGSQCTSNFLFTSPDNSSVYVGFAAHCVTKNDPNDAADGCDPASEPLAIGTKVDVEGADHSATLVYTSWGTMQANRGSNDEECLYNDFALARLDDRDAAKANPAMLFFGGPTALADPGDVGTLDKVMTYGDSGLRGGISTLSPHEGYVLFSPGPDGWTTEIYTLPQGIPGDSGSGVLLADGAALGILVTISYVGASNGVTTLANALDYAAAEGGMPVRLATADLLDPGLLPPL